MYALQKFGIKLGLENITRLCAHLGNPQSKFISFHIAGTNGKGSTSSFIASLLKEAGYKTGLYTSPHFVRFNERIRINGTEIPDEYISDFYKSIERFIEEYRPTFFEVTTAMAFKYFADLKVEYASIEVGLGGRLDATNVILPCASVITSISLEHTEILGCSITEIANEKAGIIKRNIPVFTGRLPLEAEKQIEQKCIDLECNLFKLNHHLEQVEESLYLKTKDLLYEICTPLIGSFQNYNSALALLAVQNILGLEKAVIGRGLRNVIRNSGIQGRYEIFSDKPRIIMDSAHNDEGIRCFLESFSTEAGKYKKRILIFGVMKDKAVKSMLADLSGVFNEIWFTSIDTERSMTREELQELGNELNLRTFVLQDAVEFIDNFISDYREDCLVILGSMYVLGDIKSKLLRKKA